ncbi:MAG: hypothetical protein IKU58_10105 [Clostridia bacterium]|nr:hypothetical protein [Clostridia bacterium]
MKKDLLYLGMGALALGILLALTGYAADGALGGLFFGMGGGLSGVGLSYLHRWNVLRGDQQSDYAKLVRQTDIEQRDERNIMLRDRSAYVTLNILSVLLGIGWAVFEALHLLGRWTPFSGHAAAVCIVLFVVMWTCHWTVLYFVTKRG